MRENYQLKISEAEEKVVEIERNLQKAKEKLDKAKDDVVLEGELYKKIKEIYIQSNNPVIREKIRVSLENIVKRYQFASDIHFDCEKAKKIRKNAGLSMKALADELKTIGSMTIHRYEKGEQGFSEKRGFTPKFKNYLLWLKERGYNPYNL